MRSCALLLLCALPSCGARTGLGVGHEADAEAPQDASIDHPVDATPDATPDVADVTQPPAPCTPPPSPTPVLLASGIQPTYDVQLGVDDSSVYMADGERVTRFPKCQPGPRQALTAVEPNAARVFVDAGTVYFVDLVLGGSIRSVSTSGGPVTTLATAPAKVQPMDLVKLGDTLYYLLEGDKATRGVYSVPAAGGKPSFVGDAAGDSIAVDGTSVYFLLESATPSSWSLRSRPIGGGPSTYLADSANEGATAVDGTHVYFTGWGASAGFVRSVSKQGGPVVTLSAPEHIPVYATLDGPYVYWVDSQDSVRREPKTGGTPEVLVTGNIGGIAIDATSLYYSTYKGELYRVDK